MTFDIREICDINLELSNNLLSQIDKEHWKLNISRQKKYEVHKFTE